MTDKEFEKEMEEDEQKITRLEQLRDSALIAYLDAGMITENEYHDIEELEQTEDPEQLRNTDITKEDSEIKYQLPTL